MSLLLTYQYAHSSWAAQAARQTVARGATSGPIEENNGALKTRPETLAPLQGANILGYRFQMLHIWLPSPRRLPTPKQESRSM
jgi:hypothetical protein